jgi:predicted XRE-type DNA-binding protein
MKKDKTYASVWDALTDTPEQAANLRARAELMQQIAAIVKNAVGRKQKLRGIVASRTRG